jgi:putative spermidine/putrescine transport system permease protein
VLILPTDQRYLALPKQGLSLKHYASFFTDPAWLSSTGQSFFIAICATTLAVLLGALCAVGCWRLPGRISNWLRLLMLAPLIVPASYAALTQFAPEPRFGPPLRRSRSSLAV